MDKQIFNLEDNNLHQSTSFNEYQAKQEFTGENVIEEDLHQFNDELGALKEGLIEEEIQRIIRPKNKPWKTILILTALLFFVAMVAQSVQWLWDTYQSNQWIYFAFAIVSFIVILLGSAEIIGEWRRLVKLKKRLILQQQSEQIYQGKNHLTTEQELEQAKTLCLNVAKNLHIDLNHPQLKQWQQQINEGYQSHEITYLFSQNIIQPFDQTAKKYVTKMAAEAAVIVAISPLALVDMFFIAWRNLRLVNKIAEIYGIELGYFTRIRLLRMVLVNIAFAGATEFVQDIGMDWLSQDITAKVSSRIAQGVGVGLLTARLGIKTMEFCRPLSFQQNEKPRLSDIQKELLVAVKQTVFSQGEKTKEKV